MRTKLALNVIHIFFMLFSSGMPLVYWNKCFRPNLPAQESYNEAQQKNAQPLHYLPAGTNILALWSSSDLSRFSPEDKLYDGCFN